MTNWNVKKGVFWVVCGVFLAFLAGISLFSPPKQDPIPQNWTIPVETVTPMSVLPPQIFHDLIRIGQQERFLTPEEVWALPEEESVHPEQNEPVLAPPAPPQAYASGQGPLIAIIIDDMGLRPQAARQAIALPGFVTLSFLPYAPELETLTQEARRAGHELMLHVPMEPLGPANPGPNALVTQMDEVTFKEKIIKNISSFDGYSGLNNHMGSKLTANHNLMSLFFNVLHEQGRDSLFFIDSRTSAASIAADESRRAGFRTARRDIFIDDQIDRAAMEAELAKLEVVARRQGSALAIGHPHALTLQLLEAWLPQAEKRGFRFVPAGQLAR